MRTKSAWLTPLALVFTALACSLPGGGGDAALYRDDFSDTDTNWCIDSDASGSLDYEDGEYVIVVGETDLFVWCNPDENFSDVHIEVTARNTGGTSDSVFGLICGYQDNDNFYYLGVGTDGYYTITKIIDNQDEVLVEEISDAIAEDAASYRIGADCANGRLVLYVDGQEIASADDDAFTSGDIGLFAWSSETLDVEVRYDDLVVTSLGE